MWQQLITPRPDITCTPGKCLVYVRETFSIPVVYPTATAAWNACVLRGTAHTDKDFPENLWLPLWFGLTNNPAGHVVLRAPDGSIYSSSSPTSNKPVHHLSIATLESYYKGKLIYRGWSEEINNVRVVQKGENMKPEALNLLAQLAWNRPVDSNDKFVKNYTGKSIEKTLADVLRSEENLSLRTKANNYDNDVKAAYERGKAEGNGNSDTLKLNAIKEALK